MASESVNRASLLAIGGVVVALTGIFGFIAMAPWADKGSVENLKTDVWRLQGQTDALSTDVVGLRERVAKLEGKVK